MGGAICLSVMNMLKLPLPEEGRGSDVSAYAIQRGGRSNNDATTARLSSHETSWPNGIEMERRAGDWAPTLTGDIGERLARSPFFSFSLSLSLSPFLFFFSLAIAP